jgi:hypothetical protein
MAAIQRAAEDARRIAIQTGTELITMRNGKICSLSPEEIAKLPPVVEPNPVAPALRPSGDRSD